MGKYVQVDAGTLKGDDRRVLLDVLSIAVEDLSYFSKHDLEHKDSLQMVDEWFDSHVKAIRAVNRFVTRNVTQYDEELGYEWWSLMDDLQEHILDMKESIWYDDLRKTEAKRKKAGKNG